MRLTRMVPSAFLLISHANAADCTQIQNDTDRLACYDLQSRLPTAVQKIAAWEIEESKSALDGSPSVNAILPAQETTDTALILRCQEKTTSVIFFKGNTSFGVSSQSPLKVLVRIGDGQVIETKWNIASNGSGVFAPSPVQFIQALSNDTRLFIRILKPGGGWLEGVFSLGDVAAVRNKIAAACSWRPK